MSDDDNSFRYHGMEFYEREAVARATEIALRETREFWLPVLEEWLTKTTDDDIFHRVMLAVEIHRLRRKLGIVPSDEERRAATRDRVRQHRERKRQGIVLRPRQEPQAPVTRASIIEDSKRQAAVWREIERGKRR